MPRIHVGWRVRTLFSVPLLCVACATTGQEESLRAALNAAHRENERLQVENEHLRDECHRTRRVLSARDRDAGLNLDPVDGQVIRADWDRGLVFINLGRMHKVAVGMRFIVWRRGKDDVAERGALIRVVGVDQAESTARIHKWLDPKVPVEAGMSISNPLYDPHRTLSVYVCGKLRLYWTETVRQYLPQTNARMVWRLDDTVDVIVLGDRAVDADGPFMDEAEAERARERARLERVHLRHEVIEKARLIGALVVTEDALRLFLA